MPNNDLHGPKVAALVYEGLCLFEYSIAAEIFGLARPELGSDWYRFSSFAEKPGLLKTAGGLQIDADGDLSMLDDADIIIIPGWRGIQTLVPGEIIDKLIAAHDRGARLVSICSGAFVLAATGLLDGGRAATHWRYAEQLQVAYPQISVDADVLYIDEGPILTSAGSAAGIDLMLHIIRCDYGSATANLVARRMVIPAHRNGGQAQFIERPIARHENGRLAPLLDMVRSDLSGDWSVKNMAEASAMSLRSFIRHFQQMTGLSPGEWLTMERIEAAKMMLTEGRESIDQIAFRAGFGSADTLRHHFAKRVQLSPNEYRNRFGSFEGLA